MEWLRRLKSGKWLILGLPCLLIPLYQNMSPSPEFKDIREIAPSKPEGEWDRPAKSYFPDQFQFDSLGDVSQGLLDHNFKPMMRDLEVTYLRRSKNRFVFSEAAWGIQTEQDSGTRLSFGFVDTSKWRFSMADRWDGRDIQLVCEGKADREGVLVRMNHPLSSHLNLGLSHETNRRQSQVQVDYRW